MSGIFSLTGIDAEPVDRIVERSTTVMSCPSSYANGGVAEDRVIEGLGMKAEDMMATVLSSSISSASQLDMPYVYAMFGVPFAEVQLAQEVSRQAVLSDLADTRGARFITAEHEMTAAATLERTRHSAKLTEQMANDRNSSALSSLTSKSVDCTLLSGAERINPRARLRMNLLKNTHYPTQGSSSRRSSLRRVDLGPMGQSLAFAGSLSASLSALSEKLRHPISVQMPKPRNYYNKDLLQMEEDDPIFLLGLPPSDRCTEKLDQNQTLYGVPVVPDDSGEFFRRMIWRLSLEETYLANQGVIEASHANHGERAAYLIQSGGRDMKPSSEPCSGFNPSQITAQLFRRSSEWKSNLPERIVQRACPDSPISQWQSLLAMG